MVGNPDIVEASKGYRFGDPGGPDPREAAAKSPRNSIRNAVRRICAQDVDITQPVGHKELVKMLGRTGSTISVGQLLAAKKIAMALSGSEKMMSELTDDVDGKLVQKTVEAKTTLEDLVNGEFDGGDKEGEE